MAQNNTELAYKHLRKRILAGELSPGVPLQTIDLSKEIGVSRTPIRDALRMLELDGLVTIESRSGAKVRTLTIKDFKELCEFRQALEGFCCSLAAKNRSSSDLAQIEFHLLKMETLIEEMSCASKPLARLPELAQEDSRFHLAISLASGNHLLHNELIRLQLIFRVIAGHQTKVSSIIDEQEWIRRRREIHEEHTGIYEAIKACDREKSRSRIDEHILNISKTRIIQMEREEHSLLMDRMGI